MIEAGAFTEAARARGFDFYAGVPCSFLTATINRVISDRTLDYVGAASEGEAVAVAAGAWLCGRETVVMCQNSGLGNTVNPLTSLNFPFRIPTMLLVTWRGQPGLADEPQHELMGRITDPLLALMRIPSRPFPRAEAEIAPALSAAASEMARSGLPFAFVLPKGGVRDEALDQPEPAAPDAGTVEDLRDGGPPPRRIGVLERFLALAPPDAAVIASTGYCGRELFTLDDRDRHLYQVGSMGCASGMGLGVALNRAAPVVVLDGDGAALMKLGSVATIGARAPGNLIHVVLDNGVHESTGGQATASASVEFAEIAVACGYRNAAKCDSVAGFAQAFAGALARPGPWLIHVRIGPGSIDRLGRPTVTPAEVARRFKAFLTDAGAAPAR